VYISSGLMQKLIFTENVEILNIGKNKLNGK